MINVNSHFLSFEEESNLAHIKILYNFQDYTFLKKFIDEFKNILIYVEDNDKIDILTISKLPTQVDSNSYSNFKTALREEIIDIHLFTAWEKVVTSLERLSKCTIAKLSGDIAGTFLQLALVCDYKISMPDTTFCFPEINYGILPGMAVYRLAKYIGLGCAKKLILSGDIISAENALSLHLIDKIARNNEEFLQFKYQINNEKSLTSIIMARRLLNESFHDSYEDAIGHYLAAQNRCLNALNKTTKQSENKRIIEKVIG